MLCNVMGWYGNWLWHGLSTWESRYGNGDVAYGIGIELCGMGTGSVLHCSVYIVAYIN